MRVKVLQQNRKICKFGLIFVAHFGELFESWMEIYDTVS